MTDKNPCSKYLCLLLWALWAVVGECKTLAMELAIPLRNRGVEGGPSSKAVCFEQHRNCLPVGRKEEEESSRR